MENRAFDPLYVESISGGQGGLVTSISVTAGITAVASARFPGSNPNSTCQIRVSNTTTSWAYVNFGDLDLGVVTAATVAASLPVAPGAVEIFTVSSSVNGASVILGAASTGGTTVIFTRGEGL